METDSIILAINELHKKVNEALENKDMAAYVNYFDENLKYKQADGRILNQKEFTKEAERYFANLKELHTSQYRIKSSMENDIFIEKIARKSILKIKSLLFLIKKQTIQTEEIYHWKNIDGKWKVVEVEMLLEEKY